MLDTTVTALADAFMEVGVYVAMLLAFFGWLQWRTGERVSQVLQEHRHWAPLVGALLGVSPGCAGALLVMPLYARGVVPFGAVVAALVATMGDSSWVIIAHDPTLALAIHGVLFVAGLITGYVVHALGIAPPVGPRGRDAAAATPVPVSGPATSAPALAYAFRSTGDGAASAARPRPGLLAGVGGGAIDLGLAPLTFWWLAAVGSLVSVPVVFQLADPAALASAFGGIDPYLLVGTLGTLAAVVVFAQSKGKLADDSADTIPASQGSMAAVLRNGAREVSFVITWVAAAYVAYDLVVLGTGFDAGVLAGVGAGGVIVGALVGLVPGCAIQIVFTGLYVAGGLPLPTLLANAVSQDGDALLPLLFTDRWAAITATLLTTLPALVVGFGALLVLT